jgi:large subunit ribosomal protein L25
MEEVILDVELREERGRGKVKDLRDSGFIPAVVYKEGEKSQALKIGHKRLMQLVHQHRLEGVIINLKVKGQEKAKARPCLIKEIQYHPVHGDILHVDFNEVSLTKQIKVNVPVVAKGEPIGVKQEGGSLEHVLWEVEVECLPTDIPKQIEVDVSGLKMGDAVSVRDLPVPPKVKVLNDPAAAVMQVVAPMKEEVVEAPIEGEAAAEPEVIKEKKEVPGEEAEAPAKEEKPKKEEKKEK